MHFQLCKEWKNCYYMYIKWTVLTLNFVIQMLLTSAQMLVIAYYNIQDKMDELKYTNLSSNIYFLNTQKLFNQLDLFDNFINVI